MSFFIFFFFLVMTEGIGFFFFFQAEDGIRDYKVTGVQTCALPICPTGCPARALPPLRPPSQGAGRAPQMGLKGQTAAKRADRVDPNAAWQANEHESGNNPADEPVAAFRGFPSPRLRVAVSVPCGPELAMPAAGGKSRTLSKPSAARLPVCTNRVDNPHTVGPPCHGGGPRSAGWLQS